MLMIRLVAGLKPALLASLFGVLVTVPVFGQTKPLHLERDPQGSIRPFKVVAGPLAEFVREYARVSAKPITVGGSWEELKGSATLFVRRPLSEAQLTELFHRVLADNGYAVIDAPAGNGWIVERSRDARDNALPTYEASQVPNTSRTVTAYLNLKYADPEYVARTMRSFMPANSRIIPAFKQVFITDTGTNIRKLETVISRMDTPEAGKRQREISISFHGSKPSCGEQRIEKLVVEKLEIQESGPSGSSGGGSNPQLKRLKEGGKK